MSSQQARQQLRPHLRDGGAHRGTLLAEQVPEGDGVAALGEILDTDLRHPLVDFRVGCARLADAGDVAFHVCQEHRYAQVGKTLGQALQGDGFAGAGGAGDQAVTIGIAWVEEDLAGVVAADKNAVGHGVDFLW